MTAQINGVANRTAIALGRSRPLELKIEVSADKRLDTAFNTFLIVRLREGLSFNNPDKCKRNNKSDNSELKCLVDSQLPGRLSPRFRSRLYWHVFNLYRPTIKEIYYYFLCNFVVNKQIILIN